MKTKVAKISAVILALVCAIFLFACENDVGKNPSVDEGGSIFSLMN